MFRKTLTALLTALPLLCISLTIRADDTDIYIDNKPPVTDQPMVMFSVDWRPDLTSALGTTEETEAREFFTKAGLGDELPTDRKLTLLDVLRLSLHLVLSNLSGVKVGLMLNHNHNVNCAGQSQTGCSNGGYIARGLVSLDTSGSLDEFLNILREIPLHQAVSDSSGHPYQGKELFFEFFRYLTGQRIFNNANGWRDYATDNTLNLGLLNDPLSGDNYLIGRDGNVTIKGSDGGFEFISPLASASHCAKIFTVNFLTGVTSQENDSDSAIQASRSSRGMGLTLSGSNQFSQVIRFLHDTDLAPEENKFNSKLTALAGKQNVTSYFVSLPTPRNSDPPKFDLTTTSYAVAGGTGAPLALTGNPQKLVETLQNIFQQILSVSTTFVAASVPVNVFNRAEIVDNVYFGLFQAEVEPFWTGNLKKLKLSTADVTDGEGNVVSRRIIIVDALDKEAISPLDGRIFDDALTFWTKTTDPLLIAGDLNGDGEIEPTSINSDSPNNPDDVHSKRDGRHVARGAAGQIVPGFIDSSGGPGDSNAAGKRKLFYLKQSTGNLEPLEATTTVADDIGAAALGITDEVATPVLNVLKYVRGQDILDEDTDTNLTEARHWVLGDPLHSRPLPINYGAALGHSRENPAIFIAMGSNDGFLRLIRNTSADGSQSGEELWAFMPPEGLAIQERLYAGRKANDGEDQHPYSVDGEPTALIIDQNGNGTIDTGGTDAEKKNDKVFLFFGLRRGGKAYYALDITNPADPKLLWRVGNDGRLVAGSNTLTDTADFAELGLTFSKPRVGAVFAGFNDDGSIKRRLAVFFAGGYNGGPTSGGVRPGKDGRGVGADDVGIGNAIYVVEALTGALIWKAVGPGSSASAGDKVFVHSQLKDGIPSSLTIIDTNADGAHDRILVGDSSGNVWRVDMGFDTDADDVITDNWKLTRLACLGRHGGANCGSLTNKENDRRFFHEPDMVQTRDANGLRYDAVIIGSGDRPNPLDKNTSELREDPITRNFFYVIRDPNVGIGGGKDTGVDGEPFRSQGDLTDISNSCLSDSSSCTVSANGWRLDLDGDSGGGTFGEKVLSAPVTIAGSIFFTTYLPPPRSHVTVFCGPAEGGGFLYAISLDDGSPVNNYDTANPEGRKSDRRLDLGTPGIPAQVVFLGSSTALGGELPGGGAAGCSLNILAGAKIFEAPGCPRFRTFWQRVE